MSSGDLSRPLPTGQAPASQATRRRARAEAPCLAVYRLRRCHSGLFALARKGNYRDSDSASQNLDVGASRNDDVGASRNDDVGGEAE